MQEVVSEARNYVSGSRVREEADGGFALVLRLGTVHHVIKVSQEFVVEHWDHRSMCKD